MNLLQQLWLRAQYQAINMPAWNGERLTSPTPSSDAIVSRWLLREDSRFSLRVTPGRSAMVHWVSPALINILAMQVEMGGLLKKRGGHEVGRVWESRGSV